MSKSEYETLKTEIENQIEKLYDNENPDYSEIYGLTKELEHLQDRYSVRKWTAADFQYLNAIGF